MDDPMLFNMHTLPSGMRLFFQRRPHLSWVGCEVVVWAGTRLCPPGKEELAHLVEHVIGCSTEGYPVLNMTQLVKWHESQHWHMNLGTTDFEYATYGGSAPIPNFEGMLQYLNAYIRRPTFAQGFEHELEIMKNERTEQGRSTEQVKAFHLMYSSLYRDPQMVSWLNDESDLDQLTMDDARAFHRQYYDCPNMDIIMVGGIEESEAIELVNRAFPPGGTTMRREPRRPDRTLITPRRKTHVLRKKGDKRKAANRPTSVSLGWYWIAPPGSDDAVTLTCDCLDQLIEERIREKWMLNYSASTEYEFYEDHRRVTIETTVNPDYEHRVRQLLIETLRDTEAIIAEIPERKAAYVRSYDVYDPDVDTTIEHAINDLLLCGRIHTVAESVTEYCSVTEDQVRQVLKDIINPERYFLDIEEI